MIQYEHTQRGRWHGLLLAIATLVAGLAIGLGDGRDAQVGLGAAALFALLAACFAHLRVRGTGDALELAFGPLRVFRRRIAYTEIRGMQATRSSWIDGWGIHFLPGRGWIWNIHGFECVELRLTGGRKLRVGTDAPDALMEFLATRVAGPAGPDHPAAPEGGSDI